MLLDEHEGPKQEPTQPEDYNPTPEQEAAVRLVDKIFKRNKKWRANYDKNWLSDYKFFRGQQWNEQRPSYRHSEVINMVFQEIQAQIPILTDSRPKFEFLPQDPSDMEFTEIINKVCESDWIRNNWLYRLTENVYDSHLYGTGFGYMGYDQKARKGLGDICFESEDPFFIFPDPNSRDVNNRSRNFVIAEPVDVEVLKEDYENGKYVKADLEDLSSGNGDKTDIENYYRFRQPVDQTKSLRESAGSVEGFLEKKALKKTLYILSNEITEEEKISDSGVAEYEQKKKYPNGRKIVTAGSVLLEDGPIEYEDGKFPYARLTNYILPREFYGISDIEQLKGPQRIFNKLVSFSLDVLTLMGNPIWVNPSNSGVDSENLFNKPGMIIEPDLRENAPYREEGVQLQPYVLQLIDRLKDWFDGLSGSTEVSRGATPGGVTAASAISSLQEAAQTRVRLKSRNLDAYLQDLGQMWLSRTLQYRDVPTIIRITGNQNATRYFQFHVQKMTDEMGQPLLDERGNQRRAAVIRDFQTDELTGQGGFGEARQIEIKGEFDVTCSTGSTLPFMKAQKAEQANQLFDRGAIDQEELLKAVEWPNFESVMARMAKKAQDDAAAQAQAQSDAEMAKAQAKVQPPLPPAPAPV